MFYCDEAAMSMIQGIILCFKDKYFAGRSVSLVPRRYGIIVENKNGRVCYSVSKGEYTFNNMPAVPFNKGRWKVGRRTAIFIC